MGIELRLMTWLSDEVDGKVRFPGARHHVNLVEPNGSVLTVVANGDSIDVFQGLGQIYSFAVTAPTAKKLAFFLLRWWILGTWCGLKLWIWRRLVSRMRSAQ